MLGTEVQGQRKYRKRELPRRGEQFPASSPAPVSLLPPIPFPPLGHSWRPEGLQDSFSNEARAGPAGSAPNLPVLWTRNPNYFCSIWVPFPRSTISLKFEKIPELSQTSVALPYCMGPAVGIWAWRRLTPERVGGCHRTGRNMLQLVVPVHNDIPAISVSRRKLTFTDHILHMLGLSFLC